MPFQEAQEVGEMSTLRRSWVFGRLDAAEAGGTLDLECPVVEVDSARLQGNASPSGEGLLPSYEIERDRPVVRGASSGFRIEAARRNPIL